MCQRQHQAFAQKIAMPKKRAFAADLGSGPIAAWPRFCSIVKAGHRGAGQKREKRER
jgi:hypothetical protein